uniref:CCHC-type domain-containing protein n=1 Tax=Clytia hemisphaerica TaxID=252671 RepID=A0A7M5WVP4_9CNID
INQGFSKYCAICHRGNHNIGECNFKRYFTWDDQNHVMKFKGEEQIALMDQIQSPHIQNQTEYSGIADAICQTMVRQGYSAKPGGNPNRKPFTPTTEQKKDLENKTCFICHQTGHQRKDCPKKKKDTVGCLNTPKEHTHTLEKIEKAEEVDFLYNITDTTPTVTLTGENEQRFEALFDTGASRTTIPQAKADRLGIDYKSNKNCVELVTASGSRIKTLGKGTLRFALDSVNGTTKIVEGEVYVLQDSINKALIGRNFYMKYNICTEGLDGQWFVSTVESLSDHMNLKKRETD